MKMCTKQQLGWFVFIWTASLCTVVAFSYTLKFIINHL
jgi:hypothetical protein